MLYKRLWSYGKRCELNTKNNKKQQEREGKSVSSRNVLSLFVSEVFAGAKVKLLCSEVFAGTKVKLLRSEALCSYSIGSVTKTLVPSFSFEEISSVPLEISIIFSTIDSPKPKPLFFLSVLP